MPSTIRSVAATTASVATMNSSTASVVRWRARCWCSKKFMLRGKARVRSGERHLGHGTLGRILDLEHRGGFEAEQIGNHAARKHFAGVVVVHDRIVVTLA